MTSKLEGGQEENVLTLLCYSEIHAFELALELEASLFSTAAYRTIAEAAISHIEAYGEPPGHHLYDLLEAKLRRGDEGILLRKTLDAMRALVAELQPGYVLNELQQFIEKRRLSMALEAASDALNAGELDKARELLAGTHDTKPNNQGIWLDDAPAMLGFLDKREEDRFTTGISELDRLGIVPIRKRFMMLIAPPKRGKSWWLVGIGKAALIGRKAVLHITLENSAEETAQRYVQSFFSLTEDDASPSKVTRFIRSEGTSTVKEMVQVTPAKAPDSLAGLGKPGLLKKLKAFKHRARLRIEAFPSGVLSFGALNNLLDKLDRVDNFKPDLLLIDAPYLMQVERADLRIALGGLMIKLKGLASQRNLALVGVHQAGRASWTAKTVHCSDVAEDASIIATVDCAITYSATPKERSRGLARLLVEACRYAKDGFMVLIAQHYPTGQFCLDSTFFTDYVEEASERFVKEVGDGGGNANG